MSTDKMISLHSLRAFDAVARHLSFSLAADELCVTQGAVSHQVTNLERCLGTILFERVKSKVHLTSKGVKLHAIVSDPLRRIRTGLRTFGPDGNDRTLKIKVPPTLGIRWFVPRLVKFHGTHPEIDVQITTSHQAVDFEHEDVDIAIHWGGGKWPGLSADFLIGEELIPVCSPELLKRTPINSLDDLNDHVLLQSMHRTNDWRIWKETVGGHDVTWHQVLKFENSALTYQAAIEQLGVVVAQRMFIDEDLAAKRLVAPFSDTAPGERAYYLVYPKERKDERKVALFRTWLLDSIANSVPASVS